MEVVFGMGGCYLFVLKPLLLLYCEAHVDFYVTSPASRLIH